MAVSSAEFARCDARSETFAQQIRLLVLRGILVLIVAGSQIGMLIVAGIYVQQGRLEDMVTPEAVTGVIAIALALLVVRIHPRVDLKDAVFPWLLAFLVYASVSELVRPDLRLGNVSTFISIAAFYLIGRTVGSNVVRREGVRIPVTSVLLAIYVCWYMAMLVFMVRGDLGFYGVLPYSNLARLQFTEGFRATEIAIHVGFQLPVLLYVLLNVRSAAQRITAILLLVCATVFVIATASVAALMAIAIVLLVFLFARIGLSMRTLAIATAASVIVGIGLISVFKDGILAATQAKVEDYEAGEGARAFIYAELAGYILTEPLGIGKGRFVENNTLSWSDKSVFPHQNFLGIGAELGVPAMILFFCFAVSGFVVLARRAWSKSQLIPREVKMVAAVGLAMFVFQQFRGLFQDTWTFRETYFWLGLSVGATAFMKGNRKPTEEGSP